MSEQIDIEQEEKRPTFLTVLCILSYITLGFAALGFIGSLVSGPPSSDQIEATEIELMKTATQFRDQGQTWAANVMEQITEFTTYQQVNFWFTTGLNALGALTGFLGVRMMWKGKRRGFHFYIIYNLIGVGGVYLVAPAHVVPSFVVISGLIFSAIFVGLYAINLKWMNK